MSFKRRDFIKSSIALSYISTSLISKSSFSAEPLKLGFQETSWGVIGMIAEAEETFKKNGVNVEVFRFDSGKAVRDAMISNRIDIGVLGTTPIIIGVSKGDVTPLAIAMYAAKTGAIVAAKDSNIKSIKDLKGKKVGSQLGSATDTIFQKKILPKFGVLPSDITVVNSKFENHIAALSGKSIDAFAGVEPFPSIAVAENIGLSIVDYSDFDIQPVWLAINKSVLEKQKANVLLFLKGWNAAVDIFQKNKDKSGTIVHSNFTKMGFTVSRKIIDLMLTKIDPNPNYIKGLDEYMVAESQVLVNEKKISAVSDWTKLLSNPLIQQISK